MKLQPAFLLLPMQRSYPGPRLFSVEHPDVFISYRWGLESAVAQRIYELLSGPPFYFKVFWDKESIPSGAIFQSYFANCVLSSRVFLPLISYDGVLRRIVLNTNSNPQRPDNVLLEHIINRACNAAHETQLCVPAFIGHGDNSPGHPWNPWDFAPSQPNAGQQNPIGDITRLGSNSETIAQARNLLSQLLPAAVNHSNVTVAELWRWFCGRNAFLFSDTELAAATVANYPSLPQL
jgi:hypothetical protein